MNVDKFGRSVTGIKFQALATFLAACAICSILVVSFNRWQIGKIADAFTNSARFSIVIGDQRQAVTSLTPALEAGFSKITLLKIGSSEPELEIGLRNGSASNPFFLSSIERSIYSDEREAVEIYRIKFVYSLLPSVLLSLVLYGSLAILFYGAYETIKRRLLVRAIESANQRKAEIQIQISTQVAHDIRSPLAALEVLVSEGLFGDSENRELALRASSRIRDIADDLLQKEKSIFSRASVELPVISLDREIELIFHEKKLQLKHSTNVQFQLEINREGFKSNEILAKVNPGDFQRVISNILNNAFEATLVGLVLIRLFVNGENAVIEIVDQGKGISPALLKKLGTRGVTDGKGKAGTGLGIFYAKSSVESWGGKLEIESEEGAGSLFRICLPQHYSSDYEKCFVLIDNDNMGRRVWEIAARKKKIKLSCFAKASEVFFQIDQFDKSTTFYIDSNLDTEKGEDVARKLYDLGYHNLYLATGYSPSHFGEMPWIKGILGKDPPWI